MMATQRLTFAPEYCGFYVSGARSVGVAIDPARGGIHATAECINIPCVYWNDSDTTITLGSYGDVAKGTEPDYDGLLETPMRSVLLFDANLPKIVEASVEGVRTRVRVWMNHPISPDAVTIALG